MHTTIRCEIMLPTTQYYFTWGTKEMKELRVIMRDLREERNIKQKVIAEYLHVSQQTYSNYENGRREIPIWVVERLAKYYKVSTDYLLSADTSYLGGTNLNSQYLVNVTMYDIIFEIQQLKPKGRKELVRYLKYLRSMEKYEAERAKRLNQ